jgi:hypothetical protein
VRERSSQAKSQPEVRVAPPRADLASGLHEELECRLPEGGHERADDLSLGRVGAVVPDTVVPVFHDGGKAQIAGVDRVPAPSDDRQQRDVRHGGDVLDLSGLPQLRDGVVEDVEVPAQGPENAQGIGIEGHDARTAVEAVDQEREVLRLVGVPTQEDLEEVPIGQRVAHGPDALQLRLDP